MLHSGSILRTDIVSGQSPVSIEGEKVDTETRFRECWAAHESRNEAKFKGCYDDAAELEIVDSAPPQIAKGADGALALAKDSWRAFPDMRSEAQLVLVNGAQVAAILHRQGTHTGTWKGKPATGKAVSYFQGQFVSLNSEAKAVRDQHWVDQGTVAHQLGLQTNERAPDAETPWTNKAWVVAAHTDDEKANLALTKKMGEAIKKGDHEGFFAHVADDVRFRYVADKDAMNGIAAFKKGFEDWVQMLDFEGTPVTMWAAGDWVVTVSDTTATMKTDMHGVAGTKGKKVRTKQLEFSQFADGKLKTHWIFENSAAYAAQLGLMDKTASP